jgi:autotransporter-associated beta strand protein
LNKTAGFDASAGTMTIGDGSGGASADVVRLLANNQIRDDKAVTIKTSGLLDLNGYSDEIQVSTIEGGAITTGSGTWTMGGHLTANATNQTATISGNVNLGANRDFTVNDGSVDADLYVTATLSGAYNLEKKGAGTLVLGGANTFSGGAVLTLGTLAVSNDLALGSGTFTLDAGTVRAEGGSRTITNAMSWAGNFSIGGSQDITFAGDATVAADRTITVDNTGVTTISGSFGDSKKIYKQGSGTLVLSGANSQAETYVQAGVINVRNSSALGGTKKTVVSDGAALELQGGLAMGNEALEIYGSGVSGGGALRSVSGANSWAGNITLKSAGTIAADADTLTISGNINQGAYAGTYAGSGNLTVSGIISGTGSLTKSGTGTLTLSGVNTFSGGATISAGTVAINSSSSLGTAAATINAGTLKATETFTETRNFTLGSSSSTMEVDASKTFTVNGVMSGTGGLVKTGNGTLIVGGANTFTGTLSVNAGTFKLGAADRISNSANVSLGGGTFHSGGYNETVGTLTLANDSIIDLGSSASVINFASSAAAAWTAGKTLTITNWNGNWMTGGGTDRIFFGSDSSGLTASQLSQIRFADPDGYYTTVAILANGEIVPVPEPATVLAVFLVGGLVAYRERRSLARLASRLRRPAG